MERYIKAWGKTCKAQMRVEDGKYILLAGAVCSPVNRFGGKSTHAEEMRKKCVFVDDILQNNIECSSPSHAAGLVTFGSINGWTHWKTEDGQPIDIYRQ